MSISVENEYGALQNYMEDLVQRTLKVILKNIPGADNMCTCDQCKLDISAIALNALPPKYIVTSRGELYTKTSALQHQFDVDIITAITRAATIVGRNPRHD